MIVYILRHAEAVEATAELPDEWRCLTVKGRIAAEKTGRRIAKFSPKARLIVTSPLTRAVQTAEIVSRRSCRRDVLVASEFLLPGVDPGTLIDYLKGCREAKRVMLVGHEPQLGMLAAALLGRRNGTVQLKKGGCVALKFDPDGDKPAGFLWYLAPGRKRITSLKKAFPRE